MHTDGAQSAGQRSQLAAIEIEDLAGVWRRTLLVDPDGSSDRTSDVYWLQLGRLCGDIRTAAIQGAGIADCQSAFAGALKRHGTAYHWDPDWTFGIPPEAPPDEGYLSWRGEILHEEGVHIDYVEHWRRVALPDLGDFACHLLDGSGVRAGLLIRIGAFAFCAKLAAGGTGAETAVSPSFFLARQNDRGWFIAAKCPSCSLRGSGFTWPELLAKAGLAKAGLATPAAGFPNQDILTMDFEIEGAVRK
jgi:hypothetical protein